jgi:hypothetical protein
MFSSLELRQAAEAELPGEGLGAVDCGVLLLIMGDGGIDDCPAVDALPGVHNQEIVRETLPDHEAFAFLASHRCPLLIR